MSFANFLKMEEMKNNVNKIHKNNFTITPHQGENNFQVIEKNANKEQPKLERLSVKKVKKCILVDSRDRNREQFPGSNRFRVHVNPSDTFVGAGLFTSLKNVESINIAQCVVPNFTGDHAYLTLVIPELQDSFIGTNDKLKQAFAILFPDTVNGNFVTCQVEKSFCSKIFSPPLANLNRLTFEFYAPDGTLVTFPTDTSPPTAVNDNAQVILILEMTLLNTNTNVIESRPIF